MKEKKRKGKNIRGTGRMRRQERGNNEVERKQTVRRKEKQSHGKIMGQRE